MIYIYKAGVVGGGAMGAEIAQTISFAGIPVVVKEINQELVQKALKKVRDIYDRRVSRGRMSAEDAEARIALVSGTTTWEGFEEVDLVVEAVPEKMEIKQQVFSELDGLCPPGTILATNNSALSTTKLARSTKRPEKVIGMHFFYPAHVMKLVEVIPGLDTAQETVDAVVSFAESLRKLPIRVNECPGFLVNRLLLPYLNEAVFAIQEGAAGLRDSDKAMTEFGFPMGPFTLMDTLGLDVCASVAQILYEGYGERMRPALLWKYLEGAGRLGVKSGAGFYLYGERAGQEDPELRQWIASVQEQTGLRGTTFNPARLLLAMINEAAQCVQENVCSPSDIDIALLAGLGFPQDKGGILHYADSLGLDEVVRGLQEHSQTLGSRFWPSHLLKRMVEAERLGVKTGRGFFEYASA